MMIPRILLIGLLLARLESVANAVPRVFRISAAQCSELPRDRFGTAFVVRGFADGHTPNVLVTALHVIHSCEYIEIEDLACHSIWAPQAPKWQLPAKQTIQVWTDW